MKRARLFVSVVAAFIFALTSAPIVRAQDYPIRTVTIIVPFAVGGTINSVARVLAPKLGQRLGKPFVIENRPGDGTVSAATARAAIEPMPNGRRNVATVPDIADDPKLTLEKKDRAEALCQSLHRLSPEHRGVTDLAYYHGKSERLSDPSGCGI
jgi:hypothetical protein